MGKKKSLDLNQKEEVLRVYKMLLRQERLKKAVASKTKLCAKTAKAVGISRASVFKVLKEDKHGNLSKPSYQGTISTKLDDFDKGIIRRKVHQMYREKIFPTVKKLTNMWNEEYQEKNVSISTMWRALRDIGFRYKMTPDHKQVLMERKDVINWRAAYLRKIEKYRHDGYHIVYLDETWCHQYQTIPRRWIDVDGKSGMIPPNQNGQRLIILHAGSDEGFVPGCKLVFKAKKNTGDYHHEMNSVHFGEWFTEKLLPNLHKPSVIVMDLAPYHRERILSTVKPTTATRKAEIQKWLDENHVPYNSKDLKARLLELVKQQPEKTQYRLEVEAKNKGHFVLWLPPKHCELNPIECIWSVLKRRVGELNIEFKFKETERLVNKVLDEIDPDLWKKEVQHIIKVETNMKKMHGIINEVAKTVINLDDESDFE